MKTPQTQPHGLKAFLLRYKASLVIFRALLDYCAGAEREFA